MDSVEILERILDIVEKKNVSDYEAYTSHNVLTMARLDSSCSMIWLLRATRRAKASGRPSAAVNGSTLSASAPPAAAASAAAPVRSILVCTSFAAIMRQQVSP